MTRIGAAFVMLALAGCSRTDDFPPGLAPLEDNTAPTQTAPYHESLTMVHDSTSSYDWVHGRGYLLGTPGEVWAKVKDAALEAESCATDSHSITPADDPLYELSFTVHYKVDKALTVEWDEQWRFGTIDGSADEPELARARYQKVTGSSFIRTLEGSIELRPTDDANVTEVALIEHVDSVGSTVDDSLASMQFRFDQLTVSLHGGTAPTCP
jgi:hypothetical protein